MDQALQLPPRFRGNFGHIPPSSKLLRDTSDGATNPPKSSASDPGQKLKATTSSRSSSKNSRPRPRPPVQTPLGILTNPTSGSQNRSASTRSASIKSAPLTRNPSKSSILDNEKCQPVINVLETTPPPREALDDTSNDPRLDENKVLNVDHHGQPQVLPNKRRSPSHLSDKTVQTLSQFPPSPSPGRRQSNLSDAGSARVTMGPPSYPASTMRRSKTRNAVGTIIPKSKKATPPKKFLQRPVPSLPVKTPPAAHLSRLPLPSPMTSPTKSSKSQPVGLTRPSATIRRPSSSRSTVAIRPTRDRPSLYTIFKDAPKPRSASSSVDRSRPITRTPFVPRTSSQESFSLSESVSASVSRSSSSSSTESIHAADVKSHTSLVSSGTMGRVSSIGSWSSQASSSELQRFEQSPDRFSPYKARSEECLPEIETASSILSLASKDISVFPMSVLTDPLIFTNLANLDLSHNPLDPVACLTMTLFLPHLRTLSMVSTGLTALTPLATHLSAPQLTHLNISSHRLSGPVPKFRYYFPRLEEVIATDGWFEVVETRTVVGLKLLDLRNNCIGEADVEVRREDWRVLGCEVLL